MRLLNRSGSIATAPSGGVGGLDRRVRLPLHATRKRHFLITYRPYDRMDGESFL